ncbi:TIGR02391 family protein [Nocardioides pinisoli]|uniref:Conserved hypothetical protein CHP02391 domain-containing protein n=1 Tax=Nocardioides pinisoli TaxID=2950279 RepID=A0ABT1L1B1_9ACTN|nr:TIGR02391 family protein [Nocardioides pinisoli]MCP3423820.1 hypothetical protein [Nocardioides pinisoli]
MKFEAAGIVASYLGAQHYLVTKLGELQVPSRFAAAIPLAMQTDSVTDEFVGLVNAAINLLDVTYGRSSPHPPICDPDLWEHIEELVRIEAWSKIPAAVATFVEDWFRKRGGDPRHESGAKLVGGDLFKRVLRDYPLGGQESERAGWRFLGMGLAQAIGNLHRHNIENREDAEQLAWGVIGLGSLLLGELRLALAARSDG